MKLLRLMFALLLCVVAGIGLSSCTKPGSGPSASTTTAGTTNGYPLTADNLTPSDSNPKAAPPPPAPPPPPIPTNGDIPPDGNEVNLTPDQAQPCLYVTTQVLLDYKANDTKKLNTFAIVNSARLDTETDLQEDTTPIESITCTAALEYMTRQAQPVKGSPGNWYKEGPGPSLQIELKVTVTYQDHKTKNFIAVLEYANGFYVVTHIL